MPLRSNCVRRGADCLKMFPSVVQRTVFTFRKTEKSQTNKKEKNCTEFGLIKKSTVNMECKHAKTDLSTSKFTEQWKLQTSGLCLQNATKKQAKIVPQPEPGARARTSKGRRENQQKKRKSAEREKGRTERRG
ncbi:LOW QUALITY PROTEIN: hypothetical protein NC652_034184 [Populus alba x Populus x berolinensis]|nr:LOW QUALITY PROTEIN: hypothetical protein NC652_034184 [Populus alba x Populus x berolinensis]